MKLNELAAAAASKRDRLCTVTSEQSRDNNKYLVYAYGQDIYRLNSAYRPIEEAVKWTSQYKINKKRSVVYMFGLGNGYFVRELMKQLQPDSRMIIIEPSYDIFYHVWNTYDLKDIFDDKRAEFFLGQEGEAEFYYSLENYVHWSNLISQIMCIHPVYDKIFSESLISYEAMIRRNNEKEIRNRNTEAVFGKRRVENTIKNLRYTKDSNVLSDLADVIPKDIPAIIVAAGPSLDKNIDLLKQAEGRAFIIGCDTALRHLKKHNIIPDAAITVDAHKPERYFDNAGFEELPVFTTASANYKALSIGHGRKIWFSGHAYQIELYKELGKKLSYRTGGGSVATAAFAVCSSLGFRRIVLVGQDLAYDGEFTHAGGEYSRIRKEEEGIGYVPGIHGNQVKSRRDWISFLQWYKTAVKSCEGESEVIDATEGGALIEGSRIMALKDVIHQYCVKRFDFLNILNHLKTFDEYTGHLVNEYLKKSLIEAVKIINLTDEGIKTADACFIDGKVLLKEAEQAAGRLSYINQEIQKLNVYCLVDEYARNETMEHVQELVNTSEDVSENIINYYLHTINIYKEMHKAAITVKEFLEEEA